MPSACASSVVKSAGTGPSSAVTVRGAGSVSTGSSCSASVAGVDAGAVDRGHDGDRAAGHLEAWRPAAPLPKTAQLVAQRRLQRGRVDGDGELAVLLRA